MRYLLIISLLFLGCQEEKIIIGQWNDYKIPAGHNYAKGAHLSAHRGELRALVKFDNSAIYKTADPSNQSDINKLVGFSDCNTPEHHVNSARIGWNWDNSQLNIFAYCYRNKVCEHKFIRTISPDSVYELRIIKLSDKYLFIVDKSSVVMDRCKSCPDGGDVLFPYFGGTETAPQDVNIKMKIY